MATLTFIERNNIEKFLGMKSGYVMDFSDRTFKEFVGEATGIDIFLEKYNYSSNSKANRLRAFMKIESNHIFGKLLSAFCAYWLSKVHTNEISYLDDEDLYKECLALAERLNSENVVQHLDALKPNNDDKDFKLLSISIRESIEKNQPETALDRLHTFLVKYVRELCETHEIKYEKSESLNAVFGKYIKYLAENKLIDSMMSEKILKYSINLIEAFNDIRNNKSLAHDNSILNYEESILIFNNLTNSIKFIQTIEEKNKTKEAQPQIESWDDLPF